MKFLLLLCITVMFLWSCGDSTNDITHVYENVDTEDAHADVSPVPESTEAFRQTSEKDTEESLVDMTEIEKLLDTWADQYQSIETHYSENTYKLLMLARMLLTNDTLTASEKMDIITECNKNMMLSRYESRRTNDYLIYKWSLLEIYWPYATHGALYLVLDEILRDVDTDNMTKTRALIQVANINRLFYKFDEAAECYYEALTTYVNDYKIDEINWLLDRIFLKQRRMYSDIDRRLVLLRDTLELIDNDINFTTKALRFNVQLAHTYMLKDNYESAAIILESLMPFDKEPEDMTGDERTYNRMLKSAKHAFKNKNAENRLIKSFWLIPSTDEIPNIRIDWRTLKHEDPHAFYSYFRGLLDELIKNEIRR